MNLCAIIRSGRQQMEYIVKEHERSLEATLGIGASRTNTAVERTQTMNDKGLIDKPRRFLGHSLRPCTDTASHHQQGGASH